MDDNVIPFVSFNEIAMRELAQIIANDLKLWSGALGADDGNKFAERVLVDAYKIFSKDAANDL